MVDTRPLLPLTFAHLDHREVNCITCHHNFTDDTGQGLCIDCHSTDPKCACRSNRCSIRSAATVTSRSMRTAKTRGPCGGVLIVMRWKWLMRLRCLCAVERSFERGGRAGCVLRRARSSRPWALEPRPSLAAEGPPNTYAPPPRVMSPSTAWEKSERALCARSSHRINHRRCQAPAVHIATSQRTVPGTRACTS